MSSGGGSLGISQHLPGEEGKALPDRGTASAKARKASTWISGLGGAASARRQGPRILLRAPQWRVQGHCPYPGVAPSISDSSEMPGPRGSPRHPRGGLPEGPLGPVPPAEPESACPTPKPPSHPHSMGLGLSWTVPRTRWDQKPGSAFTNQRGF